MGGGEGFVDITHNGNSIDVILNSSFMAILGIPLNNGISGSISSKQGI